MERVPLCPVLIPPLKLVEAISQSLISSFVSTFTCLFMNLIDLVSTDPTQVLSGRAQTRFNTRHRSSVSLVLRTAGAVCLLGRPHSVRDENVNLFGWELLGRVRLCCHWRQSKRRCFDCCFWSCIPVIPRVSWPLPQAVGFNRVLKITAKQPAASKLLNWQRQLITLNNSVFFPTTHLQKHSYKTCRICFVDNREKVSCNKAFHKTITSQQVWAGRISAKTNKNVNTLQRNQPVSKLSF